MLCHNILNKKIEVLFRRLVRLVGLDLDFRGKSESKVQMLVVWVWSLNENLLAKELILGENIKRTDRTQD
jgi:hypothetical protein